MGVIMVIGGKGLKPSKIGGKSEDVSDDADEAEDTGVSSSEARREAAKALIRAVKMSDADGVDEALAAHYEAYQGGGSEDDED